MKKVNSSFFLKPLAFFLIPLTLLFYSYLAFLAYFDQKIYPGVKIASFKTGGLTPSAAKATLELRFEERINKPLSFEYEQQNHQFNLKEAAPKLDLGNQVKQAYQVGRSGNYFMDLKDQIQALIWGINLPPQLNYQNKTYLINEIKSTNQKIKKDPLNAQITLGEKIIVTPSQKGRTIDDELLLSQIENFLTLNSPAPYSLPIKTTLPKFNTETAEQTRLILERLQNSPLKLKFEDKEWLIDQKIALTFLYVGQGNLQTELLLPASLESDQLTSRNITLEENLVLDQKKMGSYISSIASQINQKAQDARFGFDPINKRVKEFKEARSGKRLDEAKTTILITQALARNNSSEINLPVEVKNPQIVSSGADKFGVKELLGQGVSHFTGSIENRIYNIKLAASRINGVLIPPGETFSFNSVVGEISGASGYKPAYVIKSGRTVLDDGGGVCQVSTTVFRAALNSGLPITERTAHAYRVTYYEQGFAPGLDATVFSPTVDLKFKNDTPAHILIQAEVEGTTLYVSIYGTPDGRVSTVSKPVILNQTPPPAELRQDDPTLPKGVVKQIDWSAWGANVTFTRTVTRGGETLINETFRSNYRPWQAVYLVGTKEN